MTQDRAKSSQNNAGAGSQKANVATHYTLLGLHPSASVRDIRQAYRDLSKLYHPDTTELPAAIATEKFRQLNDAYATLSSPDRRQAYDQKIGYSRVVVSQPLPSLNKPKSSYSSSAYLDPTDRPFSPGEMFALFILGITFIACLILAIAIGLTRGEKAFQPLSAQEPVPLENSETEDAKDSSEEPEIKKAERFPFFPVKAPEIKSNSESQPSEASELTPETSQEPDIKKAERFTLFPVKTTEIESSSEPNSAQEQETAQETKSQPERFSVFANPTKPNSSQDASNQATIEEAKPVEGNAQPESPSSISIDPSNSAL